MGCPRQPTIGACWRGGPIGLLPWPDQGIKDTHAMPSHCVANLFEVELQPAMETSGYRLPQVSPGQVKSGQVSQEGILNVFGKNLSKSFKFLLKAF